MTAAPPGGAPRTSSPVITVSTHILDTSSGHPAAGITVELAFRGPHPRPAGPGDGEAGTDQRIGAAGGPAASTGPGAGRQAADHPRPVSAPRIGPPPWCDLAVSATDVDGRCGDFPPVPKDASAVRLIWHTGAYLGRREAMAASAGVQPAGDDATQADAFFPEVTVVFTVRPGQHYHVPLLLNPFGYSVYRGS